MKRQSRPVCSRCHKRIEDNGRLVYDKDGGRIHDPKIGPCDRAQPLVLKVGNPTKHLPPRMTVNGWRPA